MSTMDSMVSAWGLRISKVRPDAMPAWARVMLGPKNPDRPDAGEGGPQRVGLDARRGEPGDPTNVASVHHRPLTGRHRPRPLVRTEGVPRGENFSCVGVLTRAPGIGIREVRFLCTLEELIRELALRSKLTFVQQTEDIGGRNARLQCLSPKLTCLLAVRA
jgi:hypothetical protein